MPNTQQRPPLTPVRITTAAIALADAEGVEALSMRKVAGALGVSAMSLYNHVTDKDALIGRMLDHVAAEFTRPDPTIPWQDAMRQRAWSMRAAFLRHPWAPPLLVSRIVLEPAILEDIDATLACLIGAGLSYKQADWVKTALESHVYGYTMLELNMPVAEADYGEAAAEALPAIRPEQYPFMHGAAQAIITGSYDGKTEFGFGLDIILDGLNRWQERD